MKHDNFLILGIDPGLGKTGYGLIKLDGYEKKIIEGGIVKTKVKEPLEKRLFAIYKGINEIINEYKPSVIVIEEIYVHKQYPRIAMIMGYVRGILLMVAGMHSIPVVSYSSTRIKKFLTGSGRASKQQVQRMIKEQLKIKKVSYPEDVSDALAAALCHANVMSSNV
jgi:crossover junction endodeoxyribonuclease RuvC